MSVTAIHLWTCDLCGLRNSRAESTSAYSDPVITPPTGWVSDLDVPPEFRRIQNMDVCDACPECQQSPDWSNYRESH
jgi:hypothetical protein